MSTAADPVAAFNAQLAQAKAAALLTLQNLMSNLADVATARELRLIAVAILRTRPLPHDPKPAVSSAPPTPRPSPPPPRHPSPPGVAPQSPPPTPATHTRLPAADSTDPRRPRSPAAALLNRAAIHSHGLPAP